MNLLSEVQSCIGNDCWQFGGGFFEIKMVWKYKVIRSNVEKNFKWELDHFFVFKENSVMKLLLFIVNLILVLY